MIKNIKNFISVFLALTMIFAITAKPILADEITNIYINESFSDSALNGSPKGAQTEGEGSVIRVIEDKTRHKVLKIKNRWKDTTVRYSMSVTDKKIVLQTRVCKNTPSGNIAILQIVNDRGKVYDLLQLRGNIITDSMENKITRYNGGWMEAAVVLDCTNLRYDVYIDRQKKASRVKINGTFQAPKSLCVTAYANESSESEILVDYLYAYGGTKLTEFIDTKEYNEKILNSDSDKVIPPDTTQKLLLSEDFEDTALGTTSSKIAGYNGNQGAEKVVERDGTQTVAHVLRCKNGVNPYVDVPLNAVGNQIVMEARIRVSGVMEDAKLFMIRDTSATFSEMLYIRNSYTATLYNNGTVSSVSFKNEWHDIAIAADFDTHTFNVYIDKKLVKQGVSFQRSAKADGIVRFQPSSGSNGVDEQVLYLDDLKIYTGSTLCEFDTKNDENEIVSDNEEEYPYEVNDGELKTDISQLTELTTGKPDKVSDYINFNYDAKSLFDNSISLVTGQAYIGINGKRYKAQNPIIRKNNMLMAPARTLGLLAGETVGYDEQTQNITIGNKSFKSGDTEIKNGDKTVSLGGRIINIDGVTYIPLKAYAGEIWHKYCGETTNGLVVINADKQFKASSAQYTEPAREMINYLIYDRPSATTLLNLIQTRYPDKKHKRTIVTDEQLAQMDWSAQNTELGKKFSDNIIASADSILQQQITKQDTAGKALSGYKQCYQVFSLFWAYHATGDKKYLDRAAAEAENMASFERWKSSDSDWLINSAILLACGTLYDLFYDEFSQSTKDQLADAIINKGLKDAIEHYYGRGGSDWPIRNSNWNIVCNTGVIAAATAIMEEYPDICSEAVEKALISLEKEMDTFAPDGGGIEGMAYWHYTVQYMVLSFQCMENAYGDDFGIEDFPGIMETGYFPIYGSGSQDIFAYGDSDRDTHIDSSEILWFSNKTGDKQLQNARVQQYYNFGYQGAFLDLLWYMPEAYQDVALDKDAYYRTAEVATMRSSWDEFSTWVGLHAGYNSSVHGQFDIGDFEYEVYGERMATNMGRDNYNLPGYFGTRNKYYVHRAEGQNVYVINPDESAGQEEYASTTIKSLFSSDSSAAYEINMTPAYNKQVKSAKRGYKLTNGRQVFVLQDEIESNSLSDDIYWFWHTDGNVTIGQDGKTAVISKGLVQTTLYFDSNVDFKLSIDDAKPMSSSPIADGQLDGLEQKKITANFMSEQEKVIFRVTAVPMMMKYDPGVLTEIRTWVPDTTATTEAPRIENLYINGQRFESFARSKAQYDVSYDFAEGEPIITADSNGNVSISKQGTTYMIECADKNDPKLARYYILTFKSKVESGTPSGTKLTPVAFESGPTTDINTTAENVADGDLGTRWAALGDNSWMVMDFGSEKELNEFCYAIYLGNQRKQYFTLEVSTDGINYASVADVTTSGTTTDYEYIKLNSVKARYVRVVGMGNSQHKWNSFTEIAVYGN